MATEDEKPVRDFTSEAQSSNRNRQNKTLESFKAGYKGKGTWKVEDQKRIVRTTDRQPEPEKE
jgi:hypothetical protein